MPLQLPQLSLDLSLEIENGGHKVFVSGSGTRIQATFPTLHSMLHFARSGWTWRHLFPKQLSLYIAWRQIQLPMRVL